MRTSVDRVTIGSSVERRLEEAEGIRRIEADGLSMFAGPAFLSEAECAGLVALIDQGRQPSLLLSDHPDPDYRTSESCNLSPFDPLVERVEERICALLDQPRENSETVQGQRYAVGQQFKEHFDFFQTHSAYWAEQDRMGGQRTWTVMIFLNEPEAGGATRFGPADVLVLPQTGLLLAWNNLDAAGEPNRQALHEGTPVEAGVKYIVTKWFRERRWGSSD